MGGGPGSAVRGRDTGRAMSEENVEVVRRGWEGFTAGLARGDPSAGAYESGAFAPDCEWLPPSEFPGPRSYVGQEGFAEFMRLWTEDFERFELRLERLVDAGDDRVVGLFHHTAIGKASGVPVELHQGLVYDLEGGQVIRCRNYGNHAGALEAAGLSE
jgi:ketosteroid isomerase-like protein